ncbi:MAG: hypothetical protein GY939_21900 [Actinomycetia bacterium]|nr:hypothetical protein [Actinomycetes bacterium]
MDEGGERPEQVTDNKECHTTGSERSHTQLLSGRGILANLAPIVLLGSLSIGVASCASAGAGRAGQPVLRSEVAFPAGPTSSQAVEVAEWVVDDPIGEPLLALSTAEQIKAAVEEAHGRTNDVAGEMNRFVAFPAVPTPDRAELTELRADVRTTVDGNYHSITSEITLTAAESVEVIIELYQSSASELGWIPSSQTEQMVDGMLATQLTFEIPGSKYQLDDFELQVRPQGPADIRTEVRLRHVELAEISDGTVLDRFVGWAAGLPLPTGGQITGAGIQTSSVGRNSLHYSLAIAYEDLAPQDLAKTLRAALPSPTFDIEPRPRIGDPTDHWVYLRSPFFLDARVSTHAVPNIEGERTLLNVDGRVGFAPARR